MFTLSDMAASFKPYLGQVSNGVNTHVGSQALETLSKRIAMGLEDVNGSVVEGDLKEVTKAFVMACEAAATDLSKYQAISYSSALKHKDVIGIEVNTTNFTTHFSKKNYDIAMENIKNYLLIGASVAVVAGIGYFIYKMLSVKDEKKTKGPEIVANNKEIQKAKEYFIDIDLSALPKELQDKYIEIVRKESNEQLVRVAKDEIFIKQGFLAEVSSVCHNASFTNLEAFCFGRKENTWVIDLYNRHHKQFIDNTKFLADAIEAYVDGSKSIDILDIDFGAAVVRMDEARKKRLSDVKELMDTIGLEGSNLCFADVVDHFSRDPDFGAVEFFKLIKEPTVTPSASAFNDFNKAREEMVTHGKRLEKVRGELDKIMSGNKDGLQFSGNSDLIDKLKWEVDEMTAMRGFVVRETKALATSYSYIALAAKQYAVRVNAIVEELLDDGMKKDYRTQLKKAAMALPNRRMATEDIHEDYLPYGEMGLEAFNWKTAAIVGGGLALAGVIGYAIYNSSKATTGKASKVEEKIAALNNEIEKEEKKEDITVEVKSVGSGSTPKEVKLKVNNLENLAVTTHELCDIAKSAGRDVIVPTMGMESTGNSSGGVNWRFEQDDMIKVIGEGRIENMSLMAACLSVNLSAGWGPAVLKNGMTLPLFLTSSIVSCRKHTAGYFDHLKKIDQMELIDLEDGMNFDEVTKAIKLASAVSASCVAGIDGKVSLLLGPVHEITLALLGTENTEYKNLREAIKDNSDGKDYAAEVKRACNELLIAVKEAVAGNEMLEKASVSEVKKVLGSKKVDFKRVVTDIKEINREYSQNFKTVYGEILGSENDLMKKSGEVPKELKEKLNRARAVLEKDTGGMSPSDKRFVNSRKILEVVPDIIALCNSLYGIQMTVTLTVVDALETAVRINRSVMKKVVAAAGGVRMATEGLEEIYGAFSMPSVKRADHLGDGTEQSDLQSEQYLILPEYEQAGYRFDPREGSEGANLMAMESWSTGAKVAIGIAAAVAILGIGALIASTLIKRASTAADRHSSKEQDKQAIEKAAVIDSNIARLEDRWKKILIKARSINDLKTVHPQFDQIEQDIHAVFRRLNNKSVVVNGVEVPAMQEVLESFGDKRGAIVRSILATHMGDIPTPFCLSGLNGRYSQAVLNFHQEVIVGTLEKMRANVDPAKIKSYIDMWWKSGDADLINEMLTDSNRTLGEQQSHVDAYWLSGGSNEFMDNKIHRSNPMTVMNAASTSCEKLSGFIVKLKNLVETYETPDVLIKEFEKAANEAKGRGDETTVILNKMAEFKPIFAQYVRVIRYEMELIEEMMGVKDRLLKAFTRFYQDNAQELKDLDIKLIGLENQDWFK